MRERIHAPELKAERWLNSPRNVSLKELRGNVVVLDFWTYCCINCMHVLPTLEYIEKKYKEEPLVVIGVHSGKFDAERDADNIREAIGRYDIKHPVAVDSSMRIWNEYNVRSWPTLVLIRPDGTVAAVAPGEPDPSQLDSFIASQLEQACAQGTLAKGPPDLSVPAIASDNCLSYPGKVKVISHRTIVISDSGHNRLLIANVDGHVKETIGCSKRGFVDGSFEKACFNDPQGVCEYEDKLYVADTKNHAIREIDLEKRTVKTVAGTGELGGMSAGHNIAKEVALRSPWDLCSLGEHIYVAMAGSHQIWRFSPHQGTIEVFAGTGAESIDDGDVRLSSFSQPSGLAHSRGKLYVADSETSAIREIDLEKGIVRTVIGTGLFDFGDRDGEFDTAKLQHCLGLDVCDNGLLIADTYNGKIKLLSFDPPLVKTLHEGLSQPGSVSVEEDGSYFVADTNAHRVVHLWDGKEVEVSLTSSGPLEAQDETEKQDEFRSTAQFASNWFDADFRARTDEPLGNGECELVLKLRAPREKGFSQGSPLRCEIEVSRRPDLLKMPSSHFQSMTGGRECELVLPATVRNVEKETPSEVILKLSYVFCEEGDNSACVPGELYARLPVVLSRNGQNRAVFATELH